MTEAYDNVMAAAVALTTAIETFVEEGDVEERRKLDEAHPELKIAAFPCPVNFLDFMIKKHGDTPMLWVRSLAEGFEILSNLESDLAMHAFIASVLGSGLRHAIEKQERGIAPELLQALREGKFSVVEGDMARQVIDKLDSGGQLTGEQIEALKNQTPDSTGFLDRIMKGLPDAPEAD